MLRDRDILSKGTSKSVEKISHDLGGFHENKTQCGNSKIKSGGQRTNDISMPKLTFTTKWSRKNVTKI